MFAFIFLIFSTKKFCKGYVCSFFFEFFNPKCQDGRNFSEILKLKQQFTRKDEMFCVETNTKPHFKLFLTIKLDTFCRKLL